MELESLLVHKFAFFRDNSVWIEGALLFVESRVSLPALSGCCGSAKTKLDFCYQLMAAVLTLPCHRGRFDVGPASSRDNTWDHYDLANKTTLQVSYHSWIFICLDLHLEFRQYISSLMVVIRIYRLDSVFKRGNKSLWLLSHLLGENLVKIKQMIHTDSEVVVPLSSVALELFPNNLQ